MQISFLRVSARVFYSIWFYEHALVQRSPLFISFKIYLTFGNLAFQLDFSWIKKWIFQMDKTHKVSRQLIKFCIDSKLLKFLLPDKCSIYKRIFSGKEGGERKKKNSNETSDVKRDKKYIFAWLKAHNFDKELHFTTKKIVVDITISNAILTRSRIIGMFYYIIRQKILVILDVHHPLEFSRICIYNRLEKRMKDKRREITKIAAQNLLIIFPGYPTIHST